MRAAWFPWSALFLAGGRHGPCKVGHEIVRRLLRRRRPDREDTRRAKGKLYRLPHIVLFAILASVAGANSYRGVDTFIAAHLPRLRKLFGLKWRATPAYTTIRGILQQLDAASVERAFRDHAAAMAGHEKIEADRPRHIAFDGKALRRSFDNFHDRKAAHVFSAFATEPALVLGYIECDEKSNEIPAVRRAPDRSGESQPAELARRDRGAVPECRATNRMRTQRQTG